MANNRFDKKIIPVKKEMICLFSNASSDVFLKETVAMNVISLWKYWKAISRTTRTTLYGKCHSLTAKLL